MTIAVVLLSVLLSATPTLAEEMTPLIEAHEGQVAVVVKHLPSGESFAYHGDVPMPTASLIKLPIMIEAYRQAHEKQVDLDELITLTADDKVPGSGILTTHFSPGMKLSLRDAVRLMIAYSDNTATNLVLTKIGLPATNTTMEGWQLPNTKIHSLVYKGKTTIAPERSKQFGLGSTTASEMVTLLEQLHNKKLVAPEACDEMLGHLRACQDVRIGRLLPKSIKIAHKTGSVNAVRTAAGIIEAPGGPILICVLTSENKDQRWTDENAGEVLTAKLSQVAYEHFVKPQPNKEEGVVLRIGASGEEVVQLQKTLNAKMKPSPDLVVDGDFGAQTEAAVKSFQKSQGLPESGEVTPETSAALVK